MKLTLPFLVLIYASQSVAMVVYDPADVIQNTITAKNSVQALINQAQQIEFEIENLKKISPGNRDTNGAVLSQLSNLASTGQALSYGVKDSDKTFSDHFPGLKASNDFNQDYADWSGTTYDTLKSALLAMSKQGSLFAEEQDQINALRTLSEQVTGDVSAQQTAHLIALQEISQLQKLRQLLLTQGSSQNTFMAYQLQKEQSRQAAEHAWVMNSQIAFRKYTGNTGFGVNELPQVP